MAVKKKQKWDLHGRWKKRSLQVVFHIQLQRRKKQHQQGLVRHLIQQRSMDLQSPWKIKFWMVQLSKLLKQHTHCNHFANIDCFANKRDCCWRSLIQKLLHKLHYWWLARQHSSELPKMLAICQKFGQTQKQFLEDRQDFAMLLSRLEARSRRLATRKLQFAEVRPIRCRWLLRRHCSLDARWCF